MYEKAVSYSGLSLYKQCPLKWHSAYILGQREPPHPKAERGVVLHKMLEDFFNGVTPYPIADKALKPWWRFMEDLKMKPGMVAEGEIGCDANWKPMAFDDPAAYARGKKDLHWIDRDTLHLKDWKSGRIYDDHEQQGEFYAAISPDYDEVTVEFVYLDHPLVTKIWEYSRSDVDEIRKGLAEDIQILRMDTKWEATPGDKCTWCKKNWRQGGDCTKAP